jgi:pilus assembly protein CpaC
VEPPPRTEILGINQTRKIGMTTKAPIVDLQNENPTVVRIDKVAGDPTTVFVTGIARGVARLVFTDVNKRSEVVMVRTDDSEQRRLELLDLIRQVAPTAAVRVNIAPNNTVILTGYINDIDTAQRVMEAARAVFTIRDGTVVIPATVFNGMIIGGVQQVQLEVVVAAVDRSRLRQMTFDFFLNNRHMTFNSSFATSSFANSIAISPPAAAGSLTSAPGNLTFGVLDAARGFTAFLQALTTENLTKILADSRLTTLSGRPAYLVSGGETPILTSSGVGAPSVAYKQFGTVVNFLPIVENGRIHLEVRAEVSDLNAANGITIPGTTVTSVPGFSTRSAQCAVQLEDGQTLAIGGLIQNKVQGTIQRVPILGDIPFLSMAFTSKSYQETEEELLIIVTPRLVDGIACTQIPKWLPGRETRNPDDFELFLEGIMEAPRGPRYVTAHPGDYRAAHTLSPNAGQIPCAQGTGHGAHGGAGCASGQCGTGPATAAPATAAPATVAPMAPGAPVAPALPAPGTPVPAGPPVRGIEAPAIPMTPVMPAGGTSSVPPIRDVPVPGTSALPASPTPIAVAPLAPASLAPASLAPAPIAPPRALENHPVLPPVSFGPSGENR